MLFIFWGKLPILIHSFALQIQCTKHVSIAYKGMLEAASFVLYFNQGKHFVIGGKSQRILFSILFLAGYPV
jgi:hypothetical protein